MRWGELRLSDSCRHNTAGAADLREGGKGGEIGSAQWPPQPQWLPAACLQRCQTHTHWQPGAVVGLYATAARQPTCTPAHRHPQQHLATSSPNGTERRHQCAAADRTNPSPNQLPGRAQPAQLTWPASSRPRPLMCVWCEIRADLLVLATSSIRMAAGPGRGFVGFKEGFVWWKTRKRGSDACCCAACSCCSNLLHASARVLGPGQGQASDLGEGCVLLGCEKQELDQVRWERARQEDNDQRHQLLVTVAFAGNPPHLSPSPSPTRFNHFISHLQTSYPSPTCPHGTNS